MSLVFCLLFKFIVFRFAVITVIILLAFLHIMNTFLYEYEDIYFPIN